MAEALRNEPSALSTFVNRPCTYEAHGFLRSENYDAEFIDVEAAEVEDIMAACSDAEMALLACQARALAPPESVQELGAVYVVAPEDGEVCKIGIAKNPSSRLRSLQSGCWKPIELHALFWFMDGDEALIETRALRAAKQMGLRLKGEWIDGSPDVGSLLVASAIKGSHIKAADSAMMLRQREAIRNLRRRCHQ